MTTIIEFPGTRHSTDSHLTAPLPSPAMKKMDTFFWELMENDKKKDDRLFAALSQITEQLETLVRAVGKQ